VIRYLCRRRNDGRGGASLIFSFKKRKRGTEMSTKGGEMRFCVVTSAIESARSSRSHEVYSVGSLYFPACLRREHFPPDFYSKETL
jgi:hypothetical protein